jgi:hypothetical protein
MVLYRSVVTCAFPLFEGWGPSRIIRGGAPGPYPAAAVVVQLYKAWIRVPD